MKNLESILAENMRRFNTKNLNEATIQQIDPNQAAAIKFFSTAVDKKRDNLQFNTPNFFYAGGKVQGDGGLGINMSIGLYKLQSHNYGVTQFIIPKQFGEVILATRNMQSKSGAGAGQQRVFEQENIRSTNDFQLYPTNLKDIASVANELNKVWNWVGMDIATDQFNKIKPKYAQVIASIKTSNPSMWAELKPALTGTAKAVYDLINA